MFHCFARALSFSLNKPLIEVDHVQAHLYANFLAGQSPTLPAVGLVVSGGHSNLYYVPSFTQYKLFGQTRDDAVGEAFDKVARILNLGYPGGPVIDKLAQSGENSDISFKCADIENSHDFSFSGIKTAVLYYHQRHSKKNDISLNKVAYSFQNSIVKILVKKSLNLCQLKKVKTLLVGGGVAANSALRSQLKTEGQKKNIQAFFPPLDLCLDNAAMIAGLAFRQGVLVRNHKTF